MGARETELMRWEEEGEKERVTLRRQDFGEESREFILGNAIVDDK